MRKLFARLWRWITFHEDPPKSEHERLMRKFSRTKPRNEGHGGFPGSGPPAT